MTKSRNRDMPPITADLRNLPADFDAIELVRELRRARVVIANYRTAHPHTS